MANQHPNQKHHHEVNDESGQKLQKNGRFQDEVASATEAEEPKSITNIYYDW